MLRRLLLSVLCLKVHATAWGFAEQSNVAALMDSVSQIAESTLSPEQAKVVWLGMGHVAQVPAQVLEFMRLARSPHVQTICEIGFNAGHSVAAFLTANTHAKYYGFDVMTLPYSNKSLEAMQRLFPGRVEMTVGMSADTLPKFADRLTLCDVFSVDGLHDYDGCKNDVLNAVRLMRPGGIVVADDISESAPGCKQAWEEVVAAGNLTQPHCSGHWPVPGSSAKKRWCWARVSGLNVYAGPPVSWNAVTPLLLPLLEAVSKVAETALPVEQARTWFNGMGHIGQHPVQVQDYFLLARLPGVTNICEIGFNAGHSTAVFLTSNTQAKYWGFDVMAMPYANVSLETMQRLFPGRVEMTVGKSQETVVGFASKGITCDLFSVDGEHSYDACKADIENARKVMKPGGIVVVDDIVPHLPGECMKYWQSAVASGFIVDAFCNGHGRPLNGQNKGWCFGRFSDKQ